VPEFDGLGIKMAGIKVLIRQMDRLREQIRWERMKAADEAADREGRPQGHEGRT